MKGPEVIATAATTFTMSTIAYMALVSWVAGAGEMDASGRFGAAFLGVILVPLTTLLVTAFVVTYWESDRG